MTVSDFLSDINKDLRTLGVVNHFNLHFEDYKLVYFDSPRGDGKEWYLMGVDGRSKSSENLFTDPKVLISLVNLGMKIAANNGLEDKNGQLDELSFSEEIKEWCKEFGLPYEERYFKQNYAKGKDKIPPRGFCGFRLWEFKRRIALFSDHFNLWYGLAFDDIRKIIDYSKRIHQIDLNKDFNEEVSFLKEHLAYTVWSDINTEISIKYNKGTDNFEIVPYTDSLVSVAYFQFAMLMTNKAKKSVNFCSMCKDLFEIQHASTKICESCKREYHRIKTQESRRNNPKKKGVK